MLKIQRKRIFLHEFQKIWEPVLGGPLGGHQQQARPVFPGLPDHLVDDRERREGVGL